MEIDILNSMKLSSHSGEEVISCILIYIRELVACVRAWLPKLEGSHLMSGLPKIQLQYEARSWLPWGEETKFSSAICSVVALACL